MNELPLPLEEGCLAVTVNLPENNGVEVIVGKHLGKNISMNSVDDRLTILNDDMWEVPRVFCKLTDSKTGMTVEGSLLPAKNLMRVDYPPLKEMWTRHSGNVTA